MKIKFPPFKKTLYKLLKEEIELFSAAHQNETFYGAALEINVDYAEIFLNLNTEEALEHLAHHFSKTELHYIKHLNLSDNIDPAKRRDEMRWRSDEFKYVSTGGTYAPINGESWKNAWEELAFEIQDVILDFGDDEEDEDDEESSARDEYVEKTFLDKVAKVVKKLFENGVFNSLNTTPDFKVKLFSHDPLEDIQRVISQRGIEYEECEV